MKEVFTSENPCRCGFNGEGIHQCHAGRNPLYEGDRCPREAKPRLVAVMSSLAGMQMKTGVAVAYYCEECHAEAFPSR
jgi:hypothetical protein